MIVDGEYLKWTNESEGARDVVCASVTAEAVTKCEVFISDEGKTTLLDVVHAGNGGSHSWSANGGGKLIPPDAFSASDSSGRDANDQNDKQDAALG